MYPPYAEFEKVANMCFLELSLGTCKADWRISIQFSSSGLLGYSAWLISF